MSETTNVPLEFEPVEERKVVKDPDNPDWEILPIVQPLHPRFVDVWEVMQKLGGHVIGGYARWLCSPNEEPAPASDIDVFCSAGSLGDAQTQYHQLCVHLESIYPSLHEGPLSTYYFDAEDKESPSLNVVMPRTDVNMLTFGTAYEIMDMFDFTVVRAAVKNLQECIVDPDFYRDETKKQLVWKHINCPIAGVYRMTKYTAKGYHARPREVLKLFLDWDDRDSDYRDALIGNLQNMELTEEDIMELEKLLWVD